MANRQQARESLRTSFKVYVAVGEFGAIVVCYAAGSAFHLLHQSAEVIARAGNTNYSDRRSLPQVGFIEFGNGHIEALAELVLQAAQYLVFVLERLCAFYAEFQGERCDGHIVLQNKGATFVAPPQPRAAVPHSFTPQLSQLYLSITDSLIAAWRRSTRQRLSEC